MKVSKPLETQETCQFLENGGYICLQTARDSLAPIPPIPAKKLAKTVSHCGGSVYEQHSEPVASKPDPPPPPQDSSLLTPRVIPLKVDPLSRRLYEGFKDNPSFRLLRVYLDEESVSPPRVFARADRAPSCSETQRATI